MRRGSPLAEIAPIDAHDKIDSGLKFYGDLYKVCQFDSILDRSSTT
jgi:hypothetical protein